MTLACMEAVVRGHLSSNVTAGALVIVGTSWTSASDPGPAGARAWITGLVATKELTIHAAAKRDGRDQHADGGDGAEAHDDMAANKPNKAATIVQRENTTVAMRDVADRSRSSSA